MCVFSLPLLSSVDTQITDDWLRQGLPVCVVLARTEAQTCTPRAAAAEREMKCCWYLLPQGLRGLAAARWWRGCGGLDVRVLKAQREF